jgi:hypothetical protein
MLLREISDLKMVYQIEDGLSNHHKNVKGILEWEH